MITPDDDHFFGQTDLAYYITDDFKISGGYRYLNETSLGGGSAEYLIHAGDIPMSLFANADFGNDDYTHITGGLRVFLGADPRKSLIDRNRRDDPPTYMLAFPTVATRQAAASGGGSTPSTPQCTVIPSGLFKVTSPANGDCICPARTSLAGQPPAPYQGGYVCAA